MSVLGVIPCRYQSSRFPGKSLCDIGGKPMVQWTWERAGMAKLLDRLIIATDDERISIAARAFGAEVMMTDADCHSGTDRCAQVARELSSYDIVINLQGDQPFLNPETVDALVTGIITHEDVAMATCGVASSDLQQALSPGTAKIVVDRNDRALYFSRAPLPCPKSGVASLSSDDGADMEFLIHLGIYAFQRDFLLRYSQLPPGEYEHTEGLEQLRALENGYGIQVIRVMEMPLHVDTPEDAEAAREYLQKHEGQYSDSL